MLPASSWSAGVLSEITLADEEGKAGSTRGDPEGKAAGGFRGVQAAHTFLASLLTWSVWPQDTLRFHVRYV